MGTNYVQRLREQGRPTRRSGGPIREQRQLDSCKRAWVEAPEALLCRVPGLERALDQARPAGSDAGGLEAPR